MFIPVRQPLAPAPEQLLLVRFSLNQPVVTTAEVAPGPARAAILVHGEAGERLHTVVVRPVREGEAVLYRLEEPDLSDDVALDASLSFAESMGFLFDDEAPLDPRSREGAETLAALNALLGHADPADPSGGEILLDEVAARAEAPSVGPGPEARERPAGLAAPAPPLSKFRIRPSGSGVAPRGAAAAAAPPAETPRPAPPEPSRPSAVLGLGRRLLGRVRPVRRRVETDAPGPVLRMLSWF